MKKCKACKQDKEDHWFAVKIRAGGRTSRENTCTVCRARQGNGLRRDKQYELPKPFEQMLKEQEGLCKLCGKKPQKKELAVDHCHTTGRVRGLLCSNCNTGLGLFNEDVELLRAAIEYLSK